MFDVDVNMKRLGIRFKNDSFQWFRLDSFYWETVTLYTMHFQIYNFVGCLIHVELLHTAWKIVFKNT